jgi:AraC family transcriptional regulator
LAKIAVDLERALERRADDDAPGRLVPHTLARGDGWGVSDVLCTSGPRDRAFEEQHTDYAVAVVVAGSFEYRSPLGRALMTPGSVLLGNPEQSYECGHEHASGDRCVSFWFTPEYFERLAADAGVRGRSRFGIGRLPPVRVISPLVAEAAAAVSGGRDVSWEEFGLRLAARAVTLAAGVARPSNAPPPNAVSRVTRTIRDVERRSDESLTLGDLARESGLSPYHFLRTFERVAGVTPHQFILRTRLREAAVRIALEPDRILDIALDAGFGDVSNFNRTFRSEFGVSPRQYRSMAAR